MRTFILPLIVIAATSGTALAQEGDGSLEASGSIEASGEVSASTTAVPTGDSKLGLGGQLTLTGVAGLDVVFHLDDMMMLEGFLGIVNNSPDEGDGATALGIGAGFFYKLFEKGPADLYIGGRFTYFDDGSDGGFSEVGFEFPLQVRLFVHPKLAFNLEVGLGLELQSFGDADATTLFIGRGDDYAGAGFTLYL